MVVTKSRSNPGTSQFREKSDAVIDKRSSSLGILLPEVKSVDQDTIKEKARPVLLRHGVRKAYVFGSYARGDQKQDSDIDIAIQFIRGRKKTLYDLGLLREELVEALNKEVDVIVEKALPLKMLKTVRQEKWEIL